MDSLVSAYAMAQLLNNSVSAVALAQIPREEFRLRGRWVDGKLVSTWDGLYGKQMNKHEKS